MTLLWVKFTLRRPWGVKFPIICFSVSQYRFKGVVSRFSGIAAESVKNIGLKETQTAMEKDENRSQLKKQIKSLDLTCEVMTGEDT